MINLKNENLLELYKKLYPEQEILVHGQLAYTPPALLEVVKEVVEEIKEVEEIKPIKKIKKSNIK